MSHLVNKPTLIELAGLRFLIMDAPKDSNLDAYLSDCKKYNVSNIVRISEPSYSKQRVEEAGIKLHDMYYHDGMSPPSEIIEKWLKLVQNTFSKKNISDDKPPCIAVHCVAGLGRAPVLVAIALIEYGVDPISAVSFIRERRRGAINAVQLQYLESYEPKVKSNCMIM